MGGGGGCSFIMQAAISDNTLLNSNTVPIDSVGYL